MKRRHLGEIDAPKVGFPASPIDSAGVSLPHAASLLSIFGAIDAWMPVLGRLSLPHRLALDFELQARANGTDLLAELTASGIVSEEDQYRALAEVFGIGFLGSLDAAKLLVPDEYCATLLGHPEASQLARLEERNGPASVVIAPQRLDAGWMRRHLVDYPGIRNRLRLAMPSALRAALAERARGHLIRAATNSLFETFPDLSARAVANAWQGAFLGSAAAILPVAFYAAPKTTSLVFHLIFSIFFLSCVALRLCAAVTAVPPAVARAEPLSAREIPVYSVLIALHREAEIVPDLMVALGGIIWPRSKLEIKLVCEEDDDETLAAIAAQKLRPSIEVIKVPPLGPRTKPKALAYALPFTSGVFIALFDAEDRPHPMQLAEAWRRFREADEDVACLQAPLVISNAGENFVTRAFALEYAALFRGLLPWLSSNRIVLPLGGTSNHFSGLM